MDVVNGKNMIRKAWKRCVSQKQKRKMAPEGCFSVYVGEQKQRFAVRTKYANHPLFRMLLEDAEMEYGFHSEGPIRLPCDVDLFCKVLAELESGDEDQIAVSPNWSLVLLSPCRPNYSRINSGYGGYKVLNHF